MDRNIPPNQQRQSDIEKALEQAHAERDRALHEAARWRKLYETEAQQRRTEMHQAQTKIQALQQEHDHLADVIAKLQGQPLKLIAENTTEISPEQLNASPSPSEETATDNTADKMEESSIKIQTLLKTVATLELALAQEREAHQRTRTTLINAIGDALQRNA